MLITLPLLMQQEIKNPPLEDFGHLMTKPQLKSP